jgi:hypothetical protein
MENKHVLLIDNDSGENIGVIQNFDTRTFANLKATMRRMVHDHFDTQPYEITNWDGIPTHGNKVCLKAKFETGAVNMSLEQTWIY